MSTYRLVHCLSKHFPRHEKQSICRVHHSRTALRVSVHPARASSLPARLNGGHSLLPAATMGPTPGLFSLGWCRNPGVLCLWYRYIGAGSSWQLQQVPSQFLSGCVDLHRNQFVHEYPVRSRCLLRSWLHVSHSKCQHWQGSRWGSWTRFYCVSVSNNPLIGRSRF